MGKLWIRLTLAACILCLLTGEAVFAGENREDGSPVTVRLMMSNSQKPGVSAAVEAFNKDYEGKIFCDVDYVSFSDVFETLEVLMSNKSAEYDVFAVDGPNIAAYVSRGYLQPLNQWISDDEIAEFSEAMIQEGTYDGQFYGAPMGNSSMVMYYNKALLAEAGVDFDFDRVTPNHRLTWDQLLDLAREALSVLDPKGRKGLYGIEFQQVGRVYQMNVLPNSLGGAQIGEDGLSVEGVFDTEPWYDALHFYQDEVKEGLFTRGMTATETSSYFMAGKILFYIGTTALPTAFANAGFSDYGYTYIPCFRGHEDEVRTACGSWTLGMNIYSEKQDAAAEFIRYLTLYDGADTYIDASGMVPALDRQFTEALMESKPFMKLVQYEVANTALVRAVTPAFSEYSTALNALWDNVRNGADVEDAVAGCIDELNVAFQEYR